MARIKPGKPKRSPMVRFREKKMEARDKMTWFLDFLNNDIDSLKTGDFLKLVFDFAGFIYGFPSLRVPGMWGTPKERILLKKSRGFLRKRIKNILLRANPRPDTFQETLEGHSYSVPYQIVVSPDRVFKVRFLFHIWPPPFDETFKAQLVDAMIELLSQFHLSRIRTCQKPGCRKYFYRKRKGAKGDFCSPKCQNWGRINRYRVNHLDEYKKYQRDYRAMQKESQEKYTNHEPRVEVKCPSNSCGYEESRGTLKGEIKRNPNPEDCPRCKKTKLLHIERQWDGKNWVVAKEYGASEWEDFCKTYTEEG